MVEEKPNLTLTRSFVVLRFLRGCEPDRVGGGLRRCDRRSWRGGGGRGRGSRVGDLNLRRRACEGGFECASSRNEGGSASAACAAGHAAQGRPRRHRRAAPAPAATVVPGFTESADAALPQLTTFTELGAAFAACAAFAFGARAAAFPRRAKPSGAARIAAVAAEVFAVAAAPTGAAGNDQPGIGNQAGTEWEEADVRATAAASGRGTSRGTTVEATFATFAAVLADTA